MVSADLMDAIDRSLRQARVKPFTPFGGVQLVLFGDPYQLAPVPGDPEERAYYADHYRSMWFFDAKVWQEAGLRIFELDRDPPPERQRVQGHAERGAARPVTAEIAGALNGMGARRPLPEEGAITLATRNDAVNRINASALARLPGAARTAEAEIMGDFGGRAYPADAKLELKIGAQVMFLRNDSAIDGGPRWVNGTIGTVTALSDTVVVDIDGEEHEVEPASWEKFKYSYNPLTKKLVKDVVAEFSQFPLRLAWAVTIHKSQGASYERAIVDLGSRGRSAPGRPTSRSAA